jgi:hypothetical protein
MADVHENLRLAEFLLERAITMNYVHVIDLLKENVKNAKSFVEKYEATKTYSPSKLINDFFQIVAPQKNILPVSTPRVTVVAEYQNPHWV